MPQTPRVLVKRGDSLVSACPRRLELGINISEKLEKLFAIMYVELAVDVTNVGFRGSACYEHALGHFARALSFEEEAKRLLLACP